MPKWEHFVVTGRLRRVGGLRRDMSDGSAASGGT
jgi:hypothetical protein